MKHRKRIRTKAQAGGVSFELHTLGWEAFQNLCGHIAREILGQTVTTYSPSKDAGQDGAFHGSWKRQKKESYEGRFIIQCKFTSRREGHLSLADLKSEVEKATALARAGVADTYLLMTNGNVTGEADLAIRKAFCQVGGIRFFDILGSEWITQQILTSKRLRVFVPRIYGLGDLSQILDERAYSQADEILQTWKDNLTKFVPTEAHERSIQALLNEGFVLLLGDPMAGKSTIAAALALAAADRWNCLPIFVCHPNDFKDRWNPDEPAQFFWVDDAFGQVQMVSDLVAGWNRVFPMLATAIRKGARVLFTSRTYVFKAAQAELKQSAFPLLGNSQVIIEVERLTLLEKQRILYNHLRLGSQPKEFRSQIKPYLNAIAANPKFFPEVAKRLGNRFFTTSLSMSESTLRKFVEEPTNFLCEIVEQLDRAHFAALALLFMRAGRISIPPKLDHREVEALSLLGASLGDAFAAFRSLDGSLVSQVLDAGERFWRYRHPTVRDAMAYHVALRPELIDIYLGGVKTPELLSEVVCGAIEIEGAKVHVPENRFDIVIEYLQNADIKEWSTGYNIVDFLCRKCSNSFLTKWAIACEAQMWMLAGRFSPWHRSFSRLLSRLKDLKCLPEGLRRHHVKQLEMAALKSADPEFLSDSIRNLFSTSGFKRLIRKVKQTLVPSICEIVEVREQNYDDPESEPSDYFDELRSNLCVFEEFFIDDEDICYEFRRGVECIDEAIARIVKANTEIREEEERKKEEQEAFDMQYEYHEREVSMGGGQSRASVSVPSPSTFIASAPPRSIFDDVDS